MKTIKLSKGYYAIVDDAWYEMLSQVCWHAADNQRGHVYASKSFKGNRTEAMHRVIVDAKDGQIVDHINGNTLDNRVENLRLCNALGNSANCKKQTKKTSSKFKGVTWHKRDKIWQAQANGSDKKKHLGYFKTELDAARAYNSYAQSAWGEFAKLNELGDGV